MIKSKHGPIWTGKQVISTLLKNLSFDERDFTDQYKNTEVKYGLNLESRSRLEAYNWGPLGKEEGHIYIRNNELLQGVLDKNQIGDSKFGLIHSFYELYGSKKAGQLLTAFGRLLTAHLQIHGFTCGLDDALVNPDYKSGYTGKPGEKKIDGRTKIMEQAYKRGIQAGAQFWGIKIDYSGGKADSDSDKSDEPEVEDVDMIDEQEQKRVMQEIKFAIQKRFVTEGLHIEKEFDAAVQAEMNDATSKVIDEILPGGLIKSFPRNNMDAMVLTGAKGGKINRSQIACLLGQQELEGRRVPRMPNGKTLPSFAAFDPHPRASGFISDRFISGLRPQDFYFHWMAGREGLIDTAVKTARSGYLQRWLIKQLESLWVSYDMTVRDNDGSIVQFLYGEDSIDATEMLFLDKFDFLEHNYGAFLKKYFSNSIMDCIDSVTIPEVKKKLKHDKKKGKEDESTSIISEYNPARFLGSTSDKFSKNSRKFHKKQKAINQDIPEFLKPPSKKIKFSTYEKLCHLKYLKSLVHPGENVGTIAAQGIGEPSTQMTLNTFHLAGHGGANVTLGIPRLREILMTATETPKTPLMVLPLRTDKEFTDEEITVFANKFQKLQLSEVINNVKINKDFILEGKSTILTKYDLVFEFEDLDKVEETFSVPASSLLDCFLNQFMPLLMKNITKQTRKGIEDTMAVKDTKSKHMQNKEEMEDEELIEEFKKSKKERRFSGEESEIDKFSDAEGVDAEKEQKNQTQIGAYDEDEPESNGQSEISEAGDVEIEDVDEKDNKGTKLDIGGKLNSYGSQLKNINFIPQVNEPEFKRAKIVMCLHLNVDSNKNRLSKILMLSLVEAILQKVLIRSVKGINKSYVVERKIRGSGVSEKVVQTEGINFEECYDHPHVFDLNRLETNNIYEMMNHYGIEAARHAIVKEIRNVFDVYGIEVDYRHLSLVADFMTQSGTYKPFNRIGMQDSNSPFLKASFETSTAFLSDSCIKQDFDDNTTPSSSIVLGEIPKIGTGVFSLLHIP